MKRTALRAISVAAVVGTAVMSVGVSGAATATHDAPAKPETVDRRYGRGPVALRRATVSQLRLQRMAREGHAIGNHSWQEPGAIVLADRVIAGARAGGDRADARRRRRPQPGTRGAAADHHHAGRARLRLVTVPQLLGLPERVRYNGA